MLDWTLKTVLMSKLVSLIDSLAKPEVGAELFDRCQRIVSFWRDLGDMQKRHTAGDEVICSVLPQMYVALDDLLDVVQPPKKLLIEAKKMLPNWAANSFEQKPA